MLGAVILFALIFTAGAGAFEFVNQYKHNVDVTDASRMAFLQQAHSENLTMYVSLSTSPDPWSQTGDLYVSVSNTGGTPSTIVGVFVSAPNGSITSNSMVNPTSHFLSLEGTELQKGDLNLTLPITLGLGVSTSQLKGCVAGRTGCDVGISKSSFNYNGGTVVVSILTSLGNVFSLEYPTPRFLTVKNMFTVNPTLESYNIVDQSLINQFLLSQSGVVGCYGCLTDEAAGGNILVTLITASPSPVQDGGTISVIATVWNYSPYPATGVGVTLSPYYTGSATVQYGGVTVSSGSVVSCGSSTGIASQGSAVFSCSFIARSGGATGTVTFAGSALGCITTGTTTTCSNGATASSSIASSNAVQVGSTASLGLWQLSYYYFTYTDYQHQTQLPASIVAHTDTYVAYYVQVTNIYNATMDLLDGSYMQFVSPGSEVNAYIVQPGVPVTSTINYGTKVFTAYGCTDAPPSAPTDSVSGSSCIAVSPGQTVTLVFAASGAGLSTWGWGSSYSGGSNVGTTVDIILEYALLSSGAYSLHAENIPYQSVFIS